MQGRIDTSFETLQRDLFASGMAARIGMGAFGVWLAIKSHADYNTGECWPGMRRLSELTGLSLGAVSNAVHVLVEAKLLRVLAEGRGKRGNRYIARERLDVRLGDRVLCTIVLDYVPATMRATLKELDRAVTAGKGVPEALAACEIIPGAGFTWDASERVLRASIPARDIPALEASEDALRQPLVQRVLAIRDKARNAPEKG